MKPTRLSSFAGLAALVALAGCAPNPQVVAPDAFYGPPGSQGVVPQSAAGSYGQYAGNGTYGTPSGYTAPQGTYGEVPAANGAYGTYGNGAPAGYATAPSGYPGAAYGQNAYGQPVAAANGSYAAAANGYLPRGSGQYPPPSTFDVRQPYYGDGGYHLMGTYNDGEAHPLRLVSFAVAPFGYLAEWLVTRPIHRVVAQQDMAPIFSYVPQAGFDYETYEEGLSTGVTFEEPQSVD